MQLRVTNGFGVLPRLDVCDWLVTDRPLSPCQDALMQHGNGRSGGQG